MSVSVHMHISETTCPLLKLHQIFMLAMAVVSPFFGYMLCTVVLLVLWKMVCLPGINNAKGCRIYTKVRFFHSKLISR